MWQPLLIESETRQSGEAWLSCTGLWGRGQVLLGVSRHAQGAHLLDVGKTEALSQDARPWDPRPPPMAEQARS